MEKSFELGDFAVQITRKRYRGRQRFIVLGPMPTDGTRRARPLVAAGDFNYEGCIELDHGALDPEVAMNLEQRLAREFE